LIKCLQEFNAEGGSFIFTGGTALSKGHKENIQRFSEDCDFIYLNDNFSLNNPSALRRKLRKLYKELEAYLPKKGFNILTSHRHNEYKNWLFEIEYNRQIPHVEGDNLRPTLKLEVIYKNDTKIKNLPRKTVSSFLSEAKKSPPEEENLECLSVEEICAGKVSALIWRNLLEEDSDKRKPEQIRHLYDIAILEPKLSDLDDFKKICPEVIDEDLKTRQKLNSEELSDEIKKALDELESNEIHRANYLSYVTTYIYGSTNDQLSFEKAVERFITLVQKVFNE